MGLQSLSNSAALSWGTKLSQVKKNRPRVRVKAWRQSTHLRSSPLPGHPSHKPWDPYIQSFRHSSFIQCDCLRLSSSILASLVFFWLLHFNVHSTSNPFIFPFHFWSLPCHLDLDNGILLPWYSGGRNITHRLCNQTENDGVPLLPCIGCGSKFF